MMQAPHQVQKPCPHSEARRLRSKHRAARSSALVARATGSGYNVVITGSTKGLGLALARKHLEEGDSVALCSRTDESVRVAVKELRSRYGKQRVTGAACNVCKAADVQALVERAQSDLGDIDIWVNNAGTNAYSFKPLIESSESDLMDIVDTNVLGVMICCQAAIKAMRKQEHGGHIFNMDGAGSDGKPTPRFAAYGATKRALSQLGKSLQAELKAMNETKIGIHDLSPGMVTTQLLMSGADNPQSKWFINALAETPDTVADFLVPRIRDIPKKRMLPGQGPTTGQYVRFLTPTKAYSRIFARLLRGTNKGRFVAEDD